MRLAFWVFNLAGALTIYIVARPIFNAYSIPYLLAISILALIEGAWSSYAADSPTEE